MPFFCHTPIPQGMFYTSRKEVRLSQITTEERRKKIITNIKYSLISLVLSLISGLFLLPALIDEVSDNAVIIFTAAVYFLLLYVFKSIGRKD